MNKCNIKYNSNNMSRNLYNARPFSEPMTKEERELPKKIQTTKDEVRNAVAFSEAIVRNNRHLPLEFEKAIIKLKEAEDLFGESLIKLLKL